MGKKIVIGLSGHATCGKDSFCELSIPYLYDKGYSSKRVALADELKKDLNHFLIEKVGISAFTKDPKQKQLLRSFLVAYGTDIMRAIDPDVWLKRMDKNIQALFTFGGIPIITDIRYVNEFDWFADKYEFHSIYIQRKGVRAANSEEVKNNPILKEKCDHYLWWPTYGKDDISQGRHKVVKIVNKILKEAYGHVRRVKRR